MLKKLLRRRKNRLRRRTTFQRMFLTGMIMPVLLTAILGAYLVVFIRFDVYQYGSEYMEKIVGQYIRRQTDTELKKKLLSTNL